MLFSTPVTCIDIPFETLTSHRDHMSWSMTSIATIENLYIQIRNSVNRNELQVQYQNFHYAVFHAYRALWALTIDSRLSLQKQTCSFSATSLKWLVYKIIRQSKSTDFTIVWADLHTTSSAVSPQLTLYLIILDHTIAIQNTVIHLPYHSQMSFLSYSNDEISVGSMAFN